MSVHVEHGDSRDVLKSLADCSVDSCVTDPPYSLVSIQKRFGKPGSAPAQEGKDGLYRRASAGFMGQQWDTGETAHDPAFWSEVLRVLKPGAHLVAFGGTRTYHRMVCAIEDAGFEIRDQLAWCFGSGFPKSHDVSKAIDRGAGAERAIIGKTNRRVGNPDTRKIDGLSGSATFRESRDNPGNLASAPATDEAVKWEGWGTALKPSWEPICLARKPLSETTVAANVLKWGTGALNIDGCRIAPTDAGDYDYAPGEHGIEGRSRQSGFALGAGRRSDLGRWPANLCHDGSAEVLAAFPDSKAAGSYNDRSKIPATESTIGFNGRTASAVFHDGGSAARFFYSSKAGAEDRWGSKHPTVKPVELMKWLARLVTPPRGLVLDPFAGSGTTGVACLAESFDCVLIEREAAYLSDIRERLAFYEGDGRHSMVSKNRNKIDGAGPLFGANVS